MLALLGDRRGEGFQSLWVLVSHSGAGEFSSSRFNVKQLIRSVASVSPPP